MGECVSMCVCVFVFVCVFVCVCVCGNQLIERLMLPSPKSQVMLAFAFS